MADKNDRSYHRFKDESPYRGPLERIFQLRPLDEFRLF
jgi:hypothetical protein